MGQQEFAKKFCKYGHPGDRLWVREAWGACDYFDNTAPRDLPRFAAIKYFADGSIVGATAGYGLIRKARPSIHMPRQFSRILLEIVAVRVERLQDISEEDAEAEGIEKVLVSETDFRYVNYLRPDREQYPKEATCGTPVKSYASLWESISGAGSWDANPLVWVVEFSRAERIKPCA